MPSNTMAASATPPMRWASPSRPTAAVATIPSKGVVRLASIAGPAIENTRAWVIRKDEETSASTRRPYEAHDQPDRYDQHGAKHEIAPQSLEGLVAHVPDRLEQLADAADDVERVEAEHPENEPDQHRQQREPEEDDERAPAEKAVQRARFIGSGGVGDPWFLGQAHGCKPITFHDSAATRDDSIASSVSSRSASPGGLSQRSRLMRGKRIAIPDL